MKFPAGRQLEQKFENGVLHLTFNRPETKNAMSTTLCNDINAMFDAIRDEREVRVVVLRGAGGNFCSGGDIKDMAAARMAPTGGAEDAVAAYNRRFGAMLHKVNRAPQVVIAVCEGAVLGGGFGLACVADITYAHKEALFGMPETSLGIPPAQIAPFVVERIGLPQARRLGLSGARFKGDQAKVLGLAHEVFADEISLTALMRDTLSKVLRCAPNAVAVTKEIMLNAPRWNLDNLLDEAALKFAEAVRGPEGIEGTTAFIEKRPPKWAPPS